MLNTVRPAVLHSYSVPLGELPPPVPEDHFGRNELVENVFGFAQNFTSVALMGAEGLGNVARTMAEYNLLQ
jgi:hypothetical protein